MTTFRERLACKICGSGTVFTTLCEMLFKPDMGHCALELEQADRVIAFLGLSPAALAALEDGTGRVGVVRNEATENEFTRAGFVQEVK